MKRDLWIGQMVSVRPRFGERGKVVAFRETDGWYQVESESAPCPLWYTPDELAPLREGDKGFRWASVERKN